MWLLAQTSGGGTDTVAQWLQYGFGGVLLILVIGGWLWAKPAVDRILRDKERLEDEILAEVKALRAEVTELAREGRRDRPAP